MVTVREHSTSVMGWWIQCDWIMNAPSDAGAKQRYSLHFALSSGAFAFRGLARGRTIPPGLEAGSGARFLLSAPELRYAIHIIDMSMPRATSLSGPDRTVGIPRRQAA